MRVTQEQYTAAEDEAFDYLLPIFDEMTDERMHKILGIPPWEEIEIIGVDV